VGQGEAGIGCDGAVKGLDRAGVERQQLITTLNVGVARDSGRADKGRPYRSASMMDPPDLLKILPL